MLYEAIKMARERETCMHSWISLGAVGGWSEQHLSIQYHIPDETRSEGPLLFHYVISEREPHLEVTGVKTQQMSRENQLASR